MKEHIAKKKAVLLMAYGGPDSLEDIEPYLLDIRGGRPTSPELVAEIRERYAQIGGRSPLLEITCAQANALEQYLNGALLDDKSAAPSADTSTEGQGSYRVYVGMRHWKPYIREVVAQMAADGFESSIAVCMAPHASKMSTGAYLQKLREAQAAAQETRATPLEMDFIESWYDQPFLIRALARKVQAAAVQAAAAQFPAEAEMHYLFTAHSLPAVLKEQGDPYTDQLLETARLLARELGLHDGQWTFGYQSAGAAGGKWLGPSIEEILPTMAGKGIRNVLITPVGFVADHVEILFDLDIEAQEIARANGIRLVRSESLNASPDFIQGLGQMIIERMALKQDESS
jgi:ferrochelatase